MEGQTSAGVSSNISNTTTTTTTTTNNNNMAGLYQHLQSWFTISPELTTTNNDDNNTPSSSSSSSSSYSFFTLTDNNTPTITTTSPFTFTFDTDLDLHDPLDLDPCDVRYSAEYPDLTQLPWVLSLLAVLYLLIIVLSVCGNALVIVTVWRNPHMHTVTNYYIVNLAVSDLLVSMLVMPLKLLEYTGPCRWNVFGNRLLCPVISYMQPIFVFASVLTLVAISLERYYAIVHPLSAMKFNSKSRTKKILAATWLIPAVLASPYTFSRSYPFVITSHMGSIARQICNDRFDEIDALMYGEGTKDRFRRGFFMFLFLVIYLLPMVVILATCVRIAICLLQPIAVRRWPSATGKDSGRRHEENKRKVARMVIVVAVAFIVSWSPFYLSTLTSQIQSIVTDGDHFLRERNFLFTMLMIHLCGFLNSCINPFIYTGMSKKFRRSFKMILGGCICCRLKHRFLRYRDSLTRGMSAAFTSSLRHSMTEVRDANDLALNEGGHPSVADGSRYSVRSSRSSSVRARDADSSSNNLRHHHHQQQHPPSRRHNHHLRPYNICQDSSSSSDYSALPASGGSPAWKSAQKEKGGTLIEMTPMKPFKTKGGPVHEELDEEEEEAKAKAKAGAPRDIPAGKEEEKERLLGERENGSFEQTARDNEVADVTTKLLPEPTGQESCSDPSPDKSNLARNVLTGHSRAPKDTVNTSPSRVYPAVRDQPRALDMGGRQSPGFKRLDHKATVKGRDPAEDSGGGDPVVRNGGSHLTLIDADVPDEGTEVVVKGVDVTLVVPASLVQKHGGNKDSGTLTNQNGGVVHVDLSSSKGHLVQL
ncbi:uncharacterized protein LOC143281576 [Babylonia areolata]|uniref:uncharacterized protein LOC143281576 n=1 Tax=Babylonia areolata TaxID=304850 RepID=UPI003FD50710